MTIDIAALKERQDQYDSRHAALFGVFAPFRDEFIGRIRAFCHEAAAAGIRDVAFAAAAGAPPQQEFACRLNGFDCAIVVPNTSAHFWVPSNPPLGTKILVYSSDDISTPVIDIWVYESPEHGYRANVQRVYRQHERRPNGEIPRPKELYAVANVQPSHGGLAAEACLGLLYGWDATWADNVSLQAYRGQGESGAPPIRRIQESPQDD